MTIDVSILKNSLFSVVNKRFDKVIDNKVKQVQVNLGKLQERFYTELVQKTIGVNSPPSLGAFTPRWKPLAASYTRKRQALKNISPSAFYQFTGGLKQSLLRSKAVTTFGKPLISVIQGGTYKGQEVYIEGGRARTTKGRFVAKDQIKNLKAIMKVDLYPKIKESIKDMKIEENRYFSEKISMKMTNFRGGRDRPVLVHYMNWWLYVKATAVVKRSLTASKK